jgi:hypothetical protein
MTTYLVGQATFNPQLVGGVGSLFGGDSLMYNQTVPIRSSFITGSTAAEFKNYILTLPDVEMQLSYPVPETPSTSWDGTGPGVQASTNIDWLTQPYPLSIFSGYNNNPNIPNLNPGGFLWTVYTTTSSSRLAVKTFLDYVPG